MLLLFVLLVGDDKPIIVYSILFHYDQQMLMLFVFFNFIYCFNQQLLLLLILLVIDGNPLLFHCILFHFDNRCYCCFID